MIETGTRAGAAGGTVGDDLLLRLETALDLPPGSLTRAAQWSATPPGVRREIRGIQAEQLAAAAALRALLSHSSLDESFKRGRLHALVSRLEGRAPDDAIPAAITPAPASRLLPVQIPLVNSVTAGYPREFTDLGYPARVADEYVLSPDVDDPDAFAARVVGDSMEPQYREGDIVVFSPARPVRHGTDCFVRLERDQETTFKRVELLPAPTPGAPHLAPTHIRLVPLNPSYPRREFPREDIAFMCPAISVTRAIN